jgi:hypothetical protein
MRNLVETSPLSITLMLSNQLAAEIVSGDPASMWPGISFGSGDVDNPDQVVYLIQVKGRQQRGLPYTYDTIKTTQWRISGQRAAVVTLAPQDVRKALSDAQLKVVVNWLMGRNLAAWLRASDEVREALGKPEPFLSVAEASRRVGIPVTTLDSAVRTVPQRVPAAQDERGFFRVRMSALNRALESGRLRSRFAHKAGRRQSAKR